MSIEILTADVLEWSRTYTGPKFHALLCDPPYHLTSITKRFGKDGAAPAKAMKSGDKAFQRLSKGFMNQSWDGGDIAFDPATWAALGQHLLPGAFGMAFAGSRGYHRMACAIEDAGFILHPAIGWVFGSGFPKATRIDKQIEPNQTDVERVEHGGRLRSPEREGIDLGTQERRITKPSTPEAQQWESHRYGLQALKPALEFICVFQKPYQGRPVDSITRTGAGALNIDAGRIGTGDDRIGGGKSGKHGEDVYKAGLEEGYDRPDGGRWPANFALAHSPECTESECAPHCAVRSFNEQAGDRGPAGSLSGAEPSDPVKNVYGGMKRTAWQAYDDEGTAARFFHNADWSYEIAEQIASADPVRYEPKASTEERSRGLENYRPTTVNDGRQKPIDNAYQRGETQRKNIHPTVKPIALDEWLAKLLLPPAAYAPRRLLVPFAGSGSECIGAFLAGWEDVLGIELGAEYADIARARLAYYTDPLALMRKAEPEVKAEPKQLSMFDKETE